MLEIIVVTPNTKPILAIFDPTTFPKEISEKPLRAACIETISSGADVENETTVSAIIIFEIFNLKDNATDDLTRYSPPITKAVKPNKTSNTSMQKILGKNKILIFSAINYFYSCITK